MATRKTLNTLTMNGNQLTPAGDPSIVMSTYSRDPMRNLDGSGDVKYVPSVDTSTFPIALNSESRSILKSLLSTTGWIASMTFRDGTSGQITKCAIVNAPSLDGDGVVELEIFGDYRDL